MNLQIDNPNKIKIFQNAIQVLSLIAEISSISIEEDRFIIKDMDSSHICLFELILDKDWFDSYDIIQSTTLGLNLKSVVKILNCLQEGQRFAFKLNTKNSDKLEILFLDKDISKKKPNMEFEINLIDRAYDAPDTSNLDYTDCDTILIKSKVFHSMVDQVANFGDIIRINYQEDSFSYSSEGNFNESKIKNAELDLNSIEDYQSYEDIEISLPINYLSRIVKASSITTDLMIKFRNKFPVSFQYIISTNSHLIYWLPPRIEEDASDGDYESDEEEEE